MTDPIADLTDALAMISGELKAAQTGRVNLMPVLAMAATRIERALRRLGELPDLKALWDRQAAWSQRTFGADNVRGPVGALKHLQWEAAEAIADPADPVEFADCLLLTLDASRRAGLSLASLLAHATAKQLRNESRAWPAPTADDEPVEHTAEAGELKTVDARGHRRILPPRAMRQALAYIGGVEQVRCDVCTANVAGHGMGVVRHDAPACDRVPGNR